MTPTTLTLERLFNIDFHRLTAGEAQVIRTSRGTYSGGAVTLFDQFDAVTLGGLLTRALRGLRETVLVDYPLLTKLCRAYTVVALVTEGADLPTVTLLPSYEEAVALYEQQCQLLHERDRAVWRQRVENQGLPVQQVAPEQPLLAWKVLHYNTDDGVYSAHGDVTWQEGVAPPREPLPLPCTSGYHASTRLEDALHYIKGPVVAQVELTGTVVDMPRSSVLQLGEPQKFAAEQLVLRECWLWNHTATRALFNALLDSPPLSERLRHSPASGLLRNLLEGTLAILRWGLDGLKELTVYELLTGTLYSAAYDDTFPAAQRRLADIAYKLVGVGSDLAALRDESHPAAHLARLLTTVRALHDPLADADTRLVSDATIDAQILKVARQYCASPFAARATVVAQSYAADGSTLD